MCIGGRDNDFDKPCSAELLLISFFFFHAPRLLVFKWLFHFLQLSDVIFSLHLRKFIFCFQASNIIVICDVIYRNHWAICYEELFSFPMTISQREKLFSNLVINSWHLVISIGWNRLILKGFSPYVASKIKQI